MHLQRPGVVLVGILELDANGDVPRLKGDELKSRNGIITIFFFSFPEAIEKRLSSARGRQTER